MDWTKPGQLARIMEVRLGRFSERSFASIIYTPSAVSDDLPILSVRFSQLSVM